MNSALKKLIIIGAIVGVLFIGYGIDSLIMSSYSIEVVNVKRSGDEQQVDINNEIIPLDCGIADGNTVVNMSIKLTRNDNPVEGHTMYVITNRSVIGRFVTDKNGLISVDYRCYKSNSTKRLSDVIVNIKDENNSIFISVPCKATYTLKMKQVKSSGEDTLTTDDFFFDI